MDEIPEGQYVDLEQNNGGFCSGSGSVSGSGSGSGSTATSSPIELVAWIIFTPRTSKNKTQRTQKDQFNYELKFYFFKEGLPHRCILLLTIDHFLLDHSTNNFVNHHCPAGNK